ncbi:hypothetical protein BABINDRAFT_173656 [Babjeviella inositovora NRRL Y-12698]|uniref:Uncharacterized protein n=1 Tax=Babjeviella inositovora NRRL Y-12698 TaxID=984486 RepID=A0A1E3QYV8_9ASCO|nr:uncharacterized protein BABINDRAFT_173656 [Babjeviella inositovora NRRL Y-12698]ODQ82816.1 hypothetical protein BABINDRAFT_173656 [Babjeviella inositovora NRRL Y-12698]
MDGILQSENPHEATHDLFVSYPVAQIHTISKQVLLEALLKKAELTGLVKEKYRDLLNVADDIHAMSSLSQRLHYQLSDLCYEQNGFRHQNHGQERYLANFARFSDFAAPSNAAFTHDRTVLLRGVVHEMVTLYGIGKTVPNVELAKLIYVVESAFPELAQDQLLSRQLHDFKVVLVAGLLRSIANCDLSEEEDSEIESEERLLQQLIIVAILQRSEPREVLRMFLAQRVHRIKGQLSGALSQIHIEALLKLVNNTLYYAIALYTRKFGASFAREVSNLDTLKLARTQDSFYESILLDQMTESVTYTESTSEVADLHTQLDGFKETTNQLLSARFRAHIDAVSHKKSIVGLVAFTTHFLLAFKAFPSLLSSEVVGSTLLLLVDRISDICSEKIASIQPLVSQFMDSSGVHADSPVFHSLVSLDLAKLSDNADFDQFMLKISGFINNKAFLGVSAVSAIIDKVDGWYEDLEHVYEVLDRQTSASASLTFTLLRSNDKAEYFNNAINYNNPIIDATYSVVNDFDEEENHDAFFARVSSFWVDIADTMSEKYLQIMVACSADLQQKFAVISKDLGDKLDQYSAGASRAKNLYYLLKMVTDLREKVEIIARFDLTSVSIASLRADFSALITKLLTEITVREIPDSFAFYSTLQRQLVADRLAAPSEGSVVLQPSYALLKLLYRLADKYTMKAEFGSSCVALFDVPEWHGEVKQVLLHEILRGIGTSIRGVLKSCNVECESVEAVQCKSEETVPRSLKKSKTQRKDVGKKAKTDKSKETGVSEKEEIAPDSKEVAASDSEKVTDLEEATTLDSKESSNLPVEIQEPETANTESSSLSISPEQVCRVYVDTMALSVIFDSDSSTTSQISDITKSLRQMVTTDSSDTVQLMSAESDIVEKLKHWLKSNQVGLLPLTM